MTLPDIEEPITPEQRERLRDIFVGRSALFRREKYVVLDVDIWRRASVSRSGITGGYQLLLPLSNLHFEPGAFTEDP